MNTQLELFPPPAEHIAFVTICPTCGQTLSTYQIDDAGQRWNKAALWSYVAQATHDRDAHAGAAA